MARNKLSDLNDHLFSQIEKLNDDDLKGSDLNMEIIRAKAMANLAKQIVGVHKTVLDAVKLSDSKSDNVNIPNTFGIEERKFSLDE